MALNMPTNPITRTALKMSAIAVGMFGFGFLLVPLYDVFCDITGLNGKTGGRYEAVPAEVDKSRVITVQFVASNNDGMMWDFKPNITEVKVHPGELKEVSFFARNPSGEDMVAQAVPSVVPFTAAEYFHKTECFCFNQQPLKAGTETDMPLVFVVDQDVPKNVHTITLSYTLFDVTEMAKTDEVASVFSN